MVITIQEMGFYAAMIATAVVLFWATDVEGAEPHVIYDCYYAEKLIYDYNVSGMILWDMDTGRFYNINYCLGINAPEVIWKWEEEK